ncbi:MAG: YebC/PmpR family DNA-binding transcriptional regulator [Flavobacteriales bacterium]|nr:YebC/PmpR family DNA-binding transcriptional regulator [Flavobacteriales bacterium]MCB9166965.1 YebC/PmpR family DNA-binding transcriptional regulator [Flavobacteriales bacterium]
MGRIFEKRKHKIFARNAKLSKMFTRIGKEISMAVKAGGPNPEANLRLRMAIQNARGANMPKDNIERAIKKAAGGEEADYFETTYEGYAPGGVAVFVDAATNNQNRTVGNVRSYFSKCESNLGTSGSLSHIFERKAEFIVGNEALKGMDPDAFEMEVIDGGADDVVRHEDVIYIYTPFQSFGQMQQKLDEMGVEYRNAELKRFPLVTAPVDVATVRKVMRLVEMLDEDEDVNAVYHNMDISDEVAEELEKD